MIQVVKNLLFLWMLGVGVGSAFAQPAPQSQCVTTAAAGGTADAITIPTLPCIPTTTLLILTIKYPNTTTTPTLAYPGSTPLPIVQFDGTPLHSGDLVANGRYLLNSNGFSWFVLSTVPPAATATGTCSNVMVHGADNTGATDTSTALSAAIAANPSGRACVYFPAGKYMFGANYNLSLPTGIASFTIKGDGPDVTELNWTNNSGGITIRQSSPNQSIHLMDFTCSTSIAGGGNCINVVGVTAPSGWYYLPTNSISNVTIRGADGYGVSQYWNIGVSLSNTSWWAIDNLYVIGPNPSAAYAAPSGTAGMVITGTGGPAGCSIVTNFDKSAFNLVSDGLIIGNCTQGITVNHTNFTGVHRGINILSGDVSTTQLNVGDSQFAAAQAGILGNSPMVGSSIHNNTFLVPSGGLGVDLEVNYLTDTLFNHLFAVTGGQGDGIKYGTSTVNQGGLIDGNTFTALNNCITLTATSGGVYLGNTNTFLSCTTAINQATGAVNVIHDVNLSTVAVTNAVPGPSNQIRLTLASTAAFVTGQFVLVSNVGNLIAGAALYVVTVVDGTTLDLQNTTATGLVYTSGGVVQTLP